MPLAGSMKLRTFLLLAGTGLAVVVLGAGGAFYLWGVPALEAQAEKVEQAREAKQMKLEAERRDMEERVAKERREAEIAQEQARMERERLEHKLALERAANPEAVVAAPPAVPVDVPTGRPVDGVVSRYLGKPLGTKKRKDVTSGKSYKVNVYQDDGQSVANRAKIDLDRDDRWDEKWTFADGVITRKVATADDENYDQEQAWQQGAWVAR